MLHGWIILDKPVGLGSTQAVGAVKRILREAGEPRTKVGHGGTLDPLASGGLPIAPGPPRAAGAGRRIRRGAGEPRTKVGHGGTLDPLASGVLPIALGEATKLAGRMLDPTKAHELTIRSGAETETRGV